MLDNGAGSDPVAGDGVYTAAVLIQSAAIGCLQVGDYKLEYTAKDNVGLNSPLIVTTMPVVNTANQPPVVSDLIAPDTIMVPSSGQNTGILSVKASDPDGSCDLKDVFFNSFNPSGTPSGSNPFALFDDGDITAHGDTTAGDGRYSLKIGISSSQTTFGYFKFQYQARDRSGITGNIITDSIYVTP